MERLTYWSEIIKGEARLNNLNETASDWYNSAQNCINRLAEYEDTGITPEEIQNDIRVHKELWEEKIKKLQVELDYYKRKVGEQMEKFIEIPIEAQSTISKLGNQVYELNKRLYAYQEIGLLPVEIEALKMERDYWKAEAIKGYEKIKELEKGEK